MPIKKLSPAHDSIKTSLSHQSRTNCPAQQIPARPRRQTFARRYVKISGRRSRAVRNFTSKRLPQAYFYGRGPARACSVFSPPLISRAAPKKAESGDPRREGESEARIHPAFLTLTGPRVNGTRIAPLLYAGSSSKTARVSLRRPLGDVVPASGRGALL